MNQLSDNQRREVDSDTTEANSRGSEGRAVKTYEKFLLACFSVLAVALAGLHLTTSAAAAKVDLVVVALLILAVIPWLGTVIKKIQMFGYTFEAQDLRDQITQQQKQISKQQEMTEELLKRQRELVDLIVVKSLHEYIYRHLRIVDDMQRRNSGEYILRAGDSNMKRDLQELMNRDFIEYFDLNGLPDITDLVKTMKITDVGRAFIQLREGHTLPPGSKT